jgi:ketosteroid isomerase-like protein
VSEDNVEVVKRGFALLSEGGYEAMLPLIAPDFEMQTPAGLAAEPDTYRGADGVRRWFEEFYEVMDDIRLEADQIHTVGEWVVMLVTVTARGRATGLEVDQKTAQAWLVRDGLARRIEFYADLDEALAALGDSAA